MKRRLGAILCASLWLLVTGSAHAAATPDHPLLDVIDGKSLGPVGTFTDTCGVAVDSAGDIYIADYYGDRIVVLSKQQTLLGVIADAVPDNGPCDLAIDGNGNLFVNEYHGEVLRLSPSSFPPTRTTTYGGATTIDDGPATGIAIDPATETLYVNRRTYVAAYATSGQPDLMGGLPVQIGSGTLEDAYGVAVSSFPSTEGRVYVGDAAEQTVYEFAPPVASADPSLSITGEGTAAGNLELVDTDLAVDPADGHLYVVSNLQPHFESPEAIVDEFSPGGYYRGTVPQPAVEGESSFLVHGEPTALAIAGSTLYVTSGNSAESLVYLFGPSSGAPAHLLSVAKGGSGGGRVTSIPAGIACGAVCSDEFDAGSVVVLKATAEAGSEFAGWTGCDQPEESSCGMTMSGDRSVEANFAIAPAAAASTASSGGSDSPVRAEAGLPGQGGETSPAAQSSAVATPGRRTKRRLRRGRSRRQRHRSVAAAKER